MKTLQKFVFNLETNWHQTLISSETNFLFGITEIFLNLSFSQKAPL
jgi:hypothetical protein